jgi:hypothetical protein
MESQWRKIRLSVKAAVGQPTRRLSLDSTNLQACQSRNWGLSRPDHFQLALGNVSSPRGAPRPSAAGTPLHVTARQLAKKWWKSRSACCAVSAWTAGSVNVRLWLPRYKLGSVNATNPALASGGSSQPRKRAPSTSPPVGGIIPAMACMVIHVAPQLHRYRVPSGERVGWCLP